MSERRRVIQVEERVPLAQGIPLSIQHLFAMFSASVLVPSIFGLNPAIVLLMNGIGTLLFILITKGKAPAYLGSSFAFISPTLLIMANPDLGYQYALGGFIISGGLFCIAALIVRFFGTNWINILLPPAAMGPVIALIGLELAGTAASMGGLVLDPSKGYNSINPKFVIVFVLTLGTAVFGSVLFRKFFAAIPVLIAIIVGYAASFFMGIIDFTPIENAHWLALPNFSSPAFNINAIMIIVPATLVVVSEHIGHQLVTGKIVNRNLIRDPGLHRTLLGDGISTMLSGFCGSVPTTTYGENIGVMAMTKVYSVYVIGGAGALSILLAFIGKVAGAIQTIPSPVMGGISFLLYGMIASSGLRLLVDEHVNYDRSRNLALSSVVFVTGLSGAYIQLGEVQLKGMALATLVGMILSLIFYIIDRFHLANDEEVPGEEPQQFGPENLR